MTNILICMYIMTTLSLWHLTRIALRNTESLTKEIMSPKRRNIKELRENSVDKERTEWLKIKDIRISIALGVVKKKTLNL